MANIKITDLTDIGTPDSLDVLEIVDVSTNTSKKVKVSELGGGVETVTGLTVDNTDPLNPIVNVPSLAQVLSIRGREINVQTGASYNLEISNKYEYISYQAGATSAQIQLVDDVFEIGDEIIIYNKDTDFLEIASSISIPPSIYYNGTNYDTQNTIIIPMYSVARMVCVANNYFELTIQEVSNSTLQQVLDNNHDLVDGKNFQGTASGQFNTGVRINAFGTGASGFNSGNDVNAFGNNAGINNSGNNVNGLGRDALASNSAEQVNAFGEEAGSGNVYKNVNLFGFQATADADNQNVFSKWVSGITKYLGRLSFNNITADRKWELPDASGTIALTSDIPAPITIDATPTDGSANAVSSNGVFDALATKFTLPALTSGSVLFSNGSTIAQDNANFFWDDTNNRLGIGNATPQARLDVRAQGALSTDIAFRVRNSADTANLLTVQGNGNIGIGTTTPTSTLQLIYSNNNFDQGFRIRNSNTGTQAITGLILEENSTGNAVGAFAYYPSNYIDATLRNSAVFSTVTTQKLGFQACAAGGVFAAQDIFFSTKSSNTNYQLQIKGNTGNVQIGTNTDIASAILNIESTIKGFLPPRMTTTQKNAIASPVAGLVVYDSTLGKLCVFTTVWETITSL